MKWSTEAEKAVSRVPLFVRRRVKKSVEEEAARAGAKEVTLAHVESSRQNFLKNMEQEVKGYQVETCFGQSGCPNRAVVNDNAAGKVETILAERNLYGFLKERVQGPLKLHHEFRVSVSDCPNACSRPQIVDLGMIGAVSPRLSEQPCSRCGTCVEICREEAVRLSEHDDRPSINYDKCVKCSQCVKVCPTGTLEKGAEGYRLLVGGKLGRHPRLARELKGIYSEEEALRVVDICLDHYVTHNRTGERFGEILERTEEEFLARVGSVEREDDSPPEGEGSAFSRRMDSHPKEIEKKS
jgi:anaerobic sulfite reductase subunit C